MQRIARLSRGFGHHQEVSVQRARHRGDSPGRSPLHRRSLRLEWIEDRSLLSVAPTGVDLLAVGDSGILDDDDLTNLDNSAVEKSLQFEISGTLPGATVTLYADGTAIGTATAAHTTTTVTTTGTHGLADGAHAITARQTEPGDTESADSPALSVTVDTVAPRQAVGQLAKLTVGDGAADDWFGRSVSISGTTAIVGADQDDNRSGSVYVLEDTGSGWVQVAKLTANDGAAYGLFGRSVSISDSVAIVGAYWNDAKRDDSGSAHLFEDTASGWVPLTKLTAADGAPSDYFGYSVSISGNTAIVGTYGDVYSRGSAYIFADTGSGWTQVAKLLAADGKDDDYFGYSVSISGDTAIIGAYGDDANINKLDSGSAGLFRLGAQLTDDTGARFDDRVTSDTTPELTFTFNEPVYGQPDGVATIGSNGDPVTPDSVTGWGTNVLTVGFNTPLTLDGEYPVALSTTGLLTDAAGNPLANAVDQTVTFTLDTQGPVVNHVLVKGTAWTESFLDALDSEALGHPTVARLGYRLPTGGGQLDTLVWGNVDTITVVFNEDVAVGQGDLAITGVNVTHYVIAAFSYDPSTYTATWTLAPAIDADRLSITLSDTVKDPSGNRLDGEWEDAVSTFPLGNGTPGGDFRFAINVLPGDANHDGIVAVADASILAAAWGYAGTGSAPADFNGDRAVDAADAAILANHWGTALPTPIEQDPPEDPGPLVPPNLVPPGDLSLVGPVQVIPSDTGRRLIDAAVAEEYDPAAAQTTLPRDRFAWSHAMARRHRASQHDDRLAMHRWAVDLLLMTEWK